MELQAIYKTGETHLQTTITEGVCDYTNGKTVKEYLSELGDGFVCVPLEDAIEQINVTQEKTYIKPWEEITEEQWDYWLGVLPPLNWETVDGVNIFQLMEKNERGNKITRGFDHGDRYKYDFELCARSKGWVHPETRRIMTYAEGDWSLVECLTEESYRAELKNMAEFYGDPPPAFKVLNYKDNTITEYYDIRPE